MSKTALLLGVVSPLDRFRQSWYRRASTRVLRATGVQLEGSPLWVSPRVYWDAPGSGLISLGDRCVVSHYVRILTHDFSLDRVAEQRDGVTDRELSRRAPVRIEARAFVGMQTILMPGVSVGEGAIVGAGSVVTKDVPPHTVVAGNPARVVFSTSEYWDRSADKFSWGPRRP